MLVSHRVSCIGPRGAFVHVKRDLLLARDAIVAVPDEGMAMGSATRAVQAVLRSASTIALGLATEQVKQ